MALYLNALDWISTDIAINVYGLIELNPIAKFMMTLPFSIWILYKMIFGTFLIYGYFKIFYKETLKRNMEKVTIYYLYIFNAMFLGVVSSNFLMVLFSIGKYMYF
jgi:hypothetical protein